MFTLIFTKNFDETYKQITKDNEELEKKIRKALHFLEQDPFYPSLKTHKANTKNYGEKWSSWATGDIRIIWDYDSEERLVIILLDIGKHSGTHKVYK
jgi:mRNA-degrading endonuclease YafQ of YafQ-DinJ toxin-antitoxin module